MVDYVSMTTGECFDHKTAIAEWLKGDEIGIYLNGKDTGARWTN